MFKRKKESHDYMQGYVGCTIWESENLKGLKYPSLSYFSGINNGSLRFYRSSESIDKMPRAIRIFVLHAEDEKAIDADIKEIINMLRYRFGRWNEIMTYPLPLNFFAEHLVRCICLSLTNTGLKSELKNLKQKIRKLHTILNLNLLFFYCEVQFSKDLSLLFGEIHIIV